MRDITEALAGAAGEAGRPVDLADVARRARRQRTVRTAALAAACSLSLLAGLGAVLGEGRRNASLEIVDDGTPTLLPSLTDTPEPTVPPSEPETETPAPTRQATPTTQPTTPSPVETGPRPASAEGRGADGLTATVTSDDVAVPAGTEVVFRVRAEDDHGHPYANVDWGDGTRLQGGHFGYMCEGIGEPDEKSPGRMDHELRRAWRQPGSYIARFRIVSGDPCGDDIPVESTIIEVPVEVSAGDASGNGAAKPIGAFEATVESWGPPLMVHASLDVSDSDGYVRRIVIDWGDGSEPSVSTNPEPCDDGGGKRYPQSRYDAHAIGHTFPGAGPYWVTMTVTTTACDGSDAQTFTDRSHVGEKP